MRPRVVARIVWRVERRIAQRRSLPALPDASLRAPVVLGTANRLLEARSAQHGNRAWLRWIYRN
jgi:hypothetical protein